MARNQSLVLNTLRSSLNRLAGNARLRGTTLIKRKLKVSLNRQKFKIPCSNFNSGSDYFHMYGGVQNVNEEWRTFVLVFI